MKLTALKKFLKLFILSYITFIAACHDKNSNSRSVSLPDYDNAAQSTNGDRPTITDVTNSLKKVYEQPEVPGVREQITADINNVEFGTSEESNYAMQLEGVPVGALVTHAKIDITVNHLHSSGPTQSNWKMKAYVYKDQFGEWTVMNVGDAH